MTLALSAAQQEVVLAAKEGIYRAAKLYADTYPGIRRKHSLGDLQQAALLAFIEALLQYDASGLVSDRHEHCYRAINARFCQMGREWEMEDEEVDPLVESDIASIDDMDQLANLLGSLDGWDRKIIEMRYGIGLPRSLSQEEVAFELGISRKAVVRDEARIAKLLRRL
jgi:RNA polymerase sigma factor (sigma-70 family)